MVFSPGVQLAGQTSSGLDCTYGGLQNAQGFINVAANRQAVDGGVHNHTIGVDDEQTTQRNTLSFIENVVGRGDFLLQVGNEGIVDISRPPWLRGSGSRPGG